MKHIFFTFFTLFISVHSAPPGHTVYDQKQTGEYNVQVHLKDIQIIALLGDEALGDYDYNYDYSDFTVKPPGSNVTLKPPPEDSNTTVSITTEKVTESTTVKVEVPSTTEKTDSISVSTSSPDRIKVQIIEEPSLAVVPSDDLGLGHSAALGEVVHYRRCANGYTRDKKGRCRRVRRPGHQHQFDISRLASDLAARFRLSEEDLSGTKKTEEH